MVRYINPYYNILTDILDSFEFLRALVKAGRKCYQSESIMLKNYNLAKEKRDIVIQDEIINKAKEIINVLYNRFGRNYYEDYPDQNVNINYDLLVDHADILKFIDMIFKRVHFSIMEHGMLSVEFIVCRGFTHELVRHRLASYSQESTRYVDYDKEKFGMQIGAIYPRDYSSWNDETILAWKTAMENAEVSYKLMRSLGQKAQIARGVLPIDTKTSITISANLRIWFDTIMFLRADTPAHPSMQQQMYPLFDELRMKIPILFDYQKVIKHELMEIGEKERELWEKWQKKIEITA